MPITFEDQLRLQDPGANTLDYSTEQRNHIIAEALTTATTLTHRRQRRGRVLIAASAAIAVAGLGYQSITTGAASAHAAEILTQAAINATDPTTRPGQYWELSTSGTNMVTEYAGIDIRVWLVRTDTTDYVAVDGKRPSWFIRQPSATIRQVFGSQAARPENTDAMIWTTNLTPEQIPASWDQPSPTWLAQLPRDTQALRDRLYADNQGHGNNPNDQAFTAIADVLRSGIVPADLRAALYLTLKTIPGTVLTDDSVTLVNGQTGVAIGRNDDIFGSHRELVIDPHNGQVLGETTRLSFIPAVGPNIATEQAIERKLVDNVPETIQRTADHQTCTVTNGEVNC